MYEKKYKTLRDEYPGSSALSSPWVHALLAHNIGAASQTDTPNSNAYFQDMCTLARGEGYTIFTVALALNATSEAILAECVGASGEAYTADSAEELTQAFEDIARLLGMRRLTS